MSWEWCRTGCIACMVYVWYVWYGMLGSAEVEEFEGLMTSEVCVKFLLDGHSLWAKLSVGSASGCTFDRAGIYLLPLSHCHWRFAQSQNITFLLVSACLFPISKRSSLKRLSEPGLLCKQKVPRPKRRIKIAKMNNSLTEESIGSIDVQGDCKKIHMTRNKNVDKGYVAM